MGKLKSFMFDVGYFAMDNGIQAAVEKFGVDEEEVKACVLFSCAYDGTWEEFQSETPENRILH
tara:strand:- start:791 stop:979 length:189 start_codon:yes stop_codon:yes gene_type:complete